MLDESSRVAAAVEKYHTEFPFREFVDKVLAYLAEHGAVSLTDDLTQTLSRHVQGYDEPFGDTLSRLWEADQEESEGLRAWKRDRGIR